MAGRTLERSMQAEIRRLKGLGMKERAIARALNCSRNTVKKYLEDILPIQVNCEQDWTSKISWEQLRSEVLKRVPLQVLWEELFEKGIVPVQYPGFWKQFSRRFPNIPQSMHREFKPGERIEIDYAKGIDVIIPFTGEIKSTELFIGVLAFSRYAFAEFTWSQKSIDFLSSHVRMFEYFGGLPQIVCPDNLKSAVTKVHRYDPVINQAYAKLAGHYEVAVVPARVRSPKDKAIVERTVQIFQRWFYMKIRHEKFTSLVELNNCLRKHLDIFHQKKHRILRRTRTEMFNEEKQHLRSLPQNSYVPATHTQAMLHSDCHLQFDKNYYSAPYQYRGKELDVWATDKIVEMYQGLDRIAFHTRLHTHGKFQTNHAHYPPQHQAYAETTPKVLRDIAKKIGPETHKLITELFSGFYPLQYLRRAQGIVRLAKRYSKEQLEDACQTANLFNQNRVSYIENLIKRGLLKREPEKQVNRQPNPLLRREELFH